MIQPENITYGKSSTVQNELFQMRRDARKMDPNADKMIYATSEGGDE